MPSTAPSAPITQLLPSTAAKAPIAVQDAGRVRLGAGMKPALVIAPARIADTGRVRLGAGMRRI